MLLKLDGVTKRFEGLTAVNKVSMAVEEGEIVGLIFPQRGRENDYHDLDLRFDETELRQDRV